MYTNMLVTLDGSKASETVLNHVERAAGPDTHVTLLTVTYVPASLALTGRTLLHDRQVRTVDENERYLEQMARPLRERGLKVETKVVLHNYEGAWTSTHAGSLGTDGAADEILRAARELSADVIVMATHGEGALARGVFGSVTERVLRAGVCPVLLVRPDKNHLNEAG